jgi:hypothetical protein
VRIFIRKKVLGFFDIVVDACLFQRVALGFEDCRSFVFVFELVVRDEVLKVQGKGSLDLEIVGFREMSSPESLCLFSPWSFLHSLIISDVF